MSKNKLRGKDLRKLGFQDTAATALALELCKKEFKYEPKDKVLEHLTGILLAPETWLSDPVWAPLANKLVVKPEVVREEQKLNEEGAPYAIYGKENIGDNAITQLETALKLPVAVKGALMPDAHVGYGLPIGGVLATENAIIPYGVGVDIGCRMCLSVFDINPEKLENKTHNFKKLLLEHTRFGKQDFSNPIDHEIFERDEFNTLPLVKKLKGKAFKQIGTSGGGNHFVEFGIVEITEDDPNITLPKGTYLGLLSHSGSRGLGAEISRYYTNLAMDLCRLPKQAKHLAWLAMDKDEGLEYWLAMNLAGDYASACHQQIHDRIDAALGEKAAFRIENHHNFAWKMEGPEGEEWIVHRKGATPAGKGELGIIPGSMTAPGFIVRGKGNLASLQSASHGAGRALSRLKARNSFTKKDLKQVLNKARVELIGGGIDESPMAYKDIHAVMDKQSELIDVLGSFLPKVVRMEKA